MTAAAAACEALLQMEGQMLGNRSSLAHLGKTDLVWVAQPFAKILEFFLSKQDKNI